MTTEAPPWPEEGVTLLVAALGAALLVVATAFGAPAPERAPWATTALQGLSATCGVLALLAIVLRGRARTWLAPTLLLSGLGAMLALLGTVPEVSALPLRGMGERVFGFPVAIGLPVAGAALLAGRGPTARALAVLGGALVLFGVLGPHHELGRTQPALLWHLRLGADLPGLAVVLFAVVAALCIAAAWIGGSDPRSPLVTALGAVAALTLPGWELARLGTGVPSAAPVLALLVLLGGTALVLAAFALGLRSDAPASPPFKHAATVVEVVAIAGVVGLWLALKSFTWRWSTSDENIYFYDAWLVAQGKLPYRDFFFAHPPLHLAAAASLFGLFGFHLRLAKLIPVAATLAIAALLWSVVRERLGRVAAFLTLAFYLFAYELIQSSTNMNGVEFAALFGVLGLVLAVRGRPALSGAALGLAITSGVYAAGIALGLVLVAWLRDNRTGLRTTLGLVATGGGLNLLFWLVGGAEYVDGVYKFHLLKEAKPITVEYLNLLYHHAPMAVGVWLAPGLLAWLLYRRTPLPGFGTLPEERKRSFFSPATLLTEPGPGLVKLCFLITVGLLVEFSRFQEIYDFYFALLLPFGAVCAGFAVTALGASLWHDARALAEARPAWARGASVTVAFFVAYTLWVPLAAEANWGFSNPGRVREDGPPLRDKRGRPRLRPFTGPILPGKGANPEFLQAGDLRSYPWIAPAAWPSVTGPLVRAFFWRDHRRYFDMAPGYRHVLWQKSLHVSIMEELVAAVREGSTADETLAGNSLIAPAVALASERRIAGGFVDTNAKRFKTGNSSLRAFFEAICNDSVRFLVIAPSGYLDDSLAQREPTVRTYFEPVLRLEDPWAKFQRSGKAAYWVTLWRLKDPYRTATPRCAYVEPSASK